MGKNIKLLRREGNSMAVEKIKTWGEKGKGEAISSSLPKILRLLGRISSGERGKGTEISGEEIKILKK